MNQDPIRSHLVRLLNARGAHVSVHEVLARFDYRLLGRKPPGAPYTPWELFEHMRLAQWDILEFSRDPNHVSPNFPDGYWPEKSAPKNQAEWDEKKSRFLSELAQMIGLVEHENADLFAALAHGTGQTLAREAMVVADHNAYHLGQMVLLSKMLTSESTESS